MTILAQIDVLDKGFVRLENVCASDLSVVNAARVSFHKKHDKIEEGDDKLIEFLMRERHGTPFEHNFFCFHVKAPIFVFREWQRHRISSYNEWSARYTKLGPEYYVPAIENVRKQEGKPGAYMFVPMDTASVAFVQTAMGDAYDKAWHTYELLLQRGLAKEVARMILPVGIYSEMYWSVNARSMMNFLSLRNSNQALFEIREYAKAIEDYFAEYMPITYEAFIRYDRRSP